MSTNTQENIITEINQEIEVLATPEATFRGLIDQLTHLNSGEEGKSMHLKLEEWPGGRWYRDLGDDTGHL